MPRGKPIRDSGSACIGLSLSTMETERWYSLVIGIAYIVLHHNVVMNFDVIDL